MVAGNAVGTVLFNAGTGNEVVLEDSPFIAAYGTDGEMDWIKTFDGFISMGAMTTTPDNALLLTGTFTEPLNLTTTGGETQTLIPAEGGTGLLLAKICE